VAVVDEALPEDFDPEIPLKNYYPTWWAEEGIPTPGEEAVTKYYAEATPQDTQPETKSMSDQGNKPDECPYCHQPLDKAPKRKKKCPNCGNFMYVRGGMPFTEDQVKERDYLNFWLSHFEYTYGISKSEFENHRAEMSKQRGFKASANDTVWSMLNKLQVNTNPNFNLKKAIDIKHDMILVYKEEGRDISPLIAELNKVIGLRFKKELAQYQANNMFTYVQIRAGERDDFSRCCPWCRSQAYTIHHKMECPIVPHNCTSELGCRCRVMPMIDEALPEDFDPTMPERNYYPTKRNEESGAIPDEEGIKISYFFEATPQDTQPETKSESDQDNKPWWKFWGK
jgi:hypothetical protein